MALLFDSQTAFSVEFAPLIGAFKFAGIGFFLSFFILWGFLQGLVFLAERYSRLISAIDWWRSGVVSAIGMIVGFFAWQVPGLFTDEESINMMSAITSTMVFGTIVSWFFCGRFYQFELLHRLIVALSVPLFTICAFALGKVLEWKMKGL